MPKKVKLIYLILLVGIVLRVIGINQSFWLDEAAQALTSGDSIYALWFLRSEDFHPPLFYLLTHLWLAFGRDEIWLRTLPIAFGVATIWVVYAFCQKLFDKKVATLSALFLAIAPLHIYYSQELRMYSTATFFAAISMYYFYLLLDKSNTKLMAGYSIVSAALIYTHYLGIFVLIAQAIYLIFLRKEYIKEFIKPFCVITLLYAPWIPQFVKQLEFGLKAEEYLPGWGGILSVSLLKAIPLTFIKFSIGRISFDNNLIYLSISLAIFLIYGFLFMRSIKTVKAGDKRLVYYWLLIPLLLTLLVSLIIPLFQPFRLLILLPPFYILLAVGILNIKRHKLLALSCVILISLGGFFIYNMDKRFHREDWRGASRFVNERIKEGGSSALFAWNVVLPPYTWYAGEEESYGVIVSYPAKREQVDSSMAQVRDKARVYLFEYMQPLSDPNNYIQAWLFGNGYQLAKTYDYNGVGFIHEFVKSNYKLKEI